MCNASITGHYFLLNLTYMFSHHASSREQEYRNLLQLWKQHSNHFKVAIPCILSIFRTCNYYRYKSSRSWGRSCKCTGANAGIPISVLPFIFGLSTCVLFCSLQKHHNAKIWKCPSESVWNITITRQRPLTVMGTADTRFPPRNRTTSHATIYLHRPQLNPLPKIESYRP